MFDGWTSERGDKLVAILLKIANEFFMIDLVVEPESSGCVWLA